MNEDVFWSVYVPNVLPFFNVPDVATAARFSLELYPRLGFEMNGHVLPFGCHAWEKWDPEFWHAHIEAQGYGLAVSARQKQRMKFSIVTPTSNSAKYLDHTISSVVSQVGNFDIEFIVVDNASTDDTSKILESYRERLDEINRQRGAGEITLKMVSQPDRGMYEAINRGFSMATGDVFAWINADDLYLPGAFEQVARVFTIMSGVRWLKGVTSYIDERGRTLSPGRCYLYAQHLLRRGLYGREAYFVQQDSVFWRADLWKAAGGLDETFRLAGDYDLWMRFAERVPLYTLNFPVSSFRRVSGQLSENLAAYRAEQERIAPPRNLRDRLLRMFFNSFEPKLPAWLNSLVFRALRPFDQLYLIDGNSENISMRQSFKYKV
jgi:glycosyltransferase involved in cell wall biosynthesis